MEQTEKITQAKNQAFANIEWAFDSIARDIEDGLKHLVQINLQIDEAKSNYNTIIDEAKNIRDEANTKLAQASTLLDEANIERANVKKLLSTLDASVEEKQQELNSINQRIDIAKIKHKDYEALESHTGVLKKNKEALEKDIENLNGQLKKLKQVLSVMEHEVSDGYSKLDKEKKEFTHFREQADRLFSQKQQDVLFREGQVAQKMKEIDDRETTVKVLEQRYKKLYGDKGTNIRI